MNKEQFKIEGMNCSHCVMAVEKSLKQIAGLHVKRVSVGSALVEFDDIPDLRKQAAEVLQKAGYELLP